MNLEEQLSRLAELGLPLAAGRTVDDLLRSWPRASYERSPFDLVLFELGSQVPAEPWGRWLCDRAWHFDTECVENQGVYVEITRQLCRIADRPDALVDVRDHIDFDSREAWLEYSVGSRRLRWDVDLQGDWADLMVVSYVMDDLEHDGQRFYARHDGQMITFFFLDDAGARRLNALAGEQLVTPFTQP